VSIRYRFRFFAMLKSSGRAALATQCDVLPQF
jgi:hypothetical protein